MTNSAVSASIARIAHATVITIIVLSLTGQLLGLAIAMRGGPDLKDAGLLFFHGLVRFAIFPGMVLAVAMFLINLAKAFRNSRARIMAPIYLAIAVLPLTSALGLVNHHKAEVMAEEHAEAEAPPTDDFRAGQAWARENRPVNNADCRGTHEFMRGCWDIQQAVRKQQFEEGKAWAKENLPARASECTRPGLPSRFIVGCRNYYLEHLATPKPAGQGKYEGMTTAECEAEVNANFELAERLYREEGNPRGAEVNRRKHWGPELNDCQNYDKVVHMALMPKAYARLQEMTGKLKAGQTIAEDEKRAILKDFTAMSALPDQPYKKAYMDLFNEYAARIHGEFKEPVVVYPQLSCEEYQSAIDAMRRKDEERVAEMASLKEANGVVRDGARHSAINQERIAALRDWKLHNDGAKAAGCELKTSS